MQFTGKNLKMVQRAVSLAIDELHNQIATCPDVKEFADDLAELQIEQRNFRRLLTRIDVAMADPACAYMDELAPEAEREAVARKHRRRRASS